MPALGQLSHSLVETLNPNPPCTPIKPHPRQHTLRLSHHSRPAKIAMDTVLGEAPIETLYPSRPAEVALHLVASFLHD